METKAKPKLNGPFQVERKGGGAPLYKIIPIEDFTVVEGNAAVGDDDIPF